MPQLILTEEQARILAAARDPVEIRTPKGNIVGRLNPPVTEDLLREIKARLASNEPKVPAARVQQLLRELQIEWDRTGGFDREYMQKFVQSFLAKE